MLSDYIPDAISCLCFSPDGSLLISGWRNLLLLNKATDGTFLRFLTGHQYPVLPHTLTNQHYYRYLRAAYLQKVQ